MPEIFQPYKPQAHLKRPGLRACEDCYSRKVKCSIDDGGLPCQQCTQHGIECRPRTRKRKAVSGAGTDDRHQPPVRQRRDQDVSEHHGRSGQAAASSLPEAEDEVTAPLLFVRQSIGTASSRAASTPSTVDKFRNSSFLSRSAILGDDFPGIDHSHGERASTQTRAPHAELGDLELLHMHKAFDLPDLATRQSLLEVFFERCWVWMPVVDLSSFELTPDAEQGSLLLLQVVMLVGALMRPHVYNKNDVRVFYRRVKALIQSSYEQDPLNILAALCLMQWYTPAAPKDISTDTPRFWNTYAIGLAQQMGLHRASPREEERPQLRRRIWFTLCARDNMTSAAHGRPRLLSRADSNLSPPSMADFNTDDQERASVFLAYSNATDILGDLCQTLTRGNASPEQMGGIHARVQHLLTSLSPKLTLAHFHTDLQQYRFDVAQLHIHVLSIIAILYRPRSIFSLSTENTASVTAATIMFRIFQAIELREQTVYLSSAFAWSLLVVAIPLLACLKVPALIKEAQCSLDVIETSLRTLGTVRPAAANNLKNVQAIRKALDAPVAHPASSNEGIRHNSVTSLEGALSPVQLLRLYGTPYVQHYERVAMVLRASSSVPLADDPNTEASIDLGSASQRIESDDRGETVTVEVDPFHDFLQTDLLTDNFWMRDWMDELRLPAAMTD